MRVEYDEKTSLSHVGLGVPNMNRVDVIDDVYCPPAPATCHVDAASTIAYAHPNRFLNPGILDEYTAHPTIMWSNGSLLVHTSTFRLSEVVFLIHSLKQYDCFAGTHRSEQTHSLGILSETAVDFSSWVIDKAVDFAELTVPLAYICSCCMATGSIAVLNIHIVIKDQDRFKSKWHPMRWFEAGHSAFISFARQVDPVKGQFVSFDADPATSRSRDGYYVASRGTFTGSLMTPFFVIGYLIRYASVFFRAYTADATGERNSVVESEFQKLEFLDPATTTLLEYDADLGFHRIAHLGRLLHTNNVPCQDLDYHCIGEYFDGHRLGWESVTDGAMDATDAATPNVIVKVNTTGTIHFSKNSSVNTPRARLIQHEDLSGMLFKESVTSSFAFTLRPHGVVRDTVFAVCKTYTTVLMAAKYVVAMIRATLKVSVKVLRHLGAKRLFSNPKIQADSNGVH
ncbi:hypothetical protein J8273_7953 [Carpediemonas membranifera]|uniref:Uncharacterized protein n=1 Tax=Carpediemonas membranifera TaxID=201153 RepID=A0A8J6B0U9_9EUKA|nr:hypothetical protein J8273_7953 [Carpediemonas membranifera]|eukprot:KAG9390602.1 hypothetical protein J8273_7953 [Carpediemonas membranifera]